MDEPDQPWAENQECRVGVIMEVTLQAFFHAMYVSGGRENTVSFNN